MASVVHCASCYGRCSVQPLQLFGRGGGLDYMSMLTYRGPRSAPRPGLAYKGPRMTLRQICRTLKSMKQLRKKEAALAAARKLAPPAPLLRRRRNNAIKRAS
ncbi:unnamed protein product [Gadus morhua 'NCC']